MLDSSFRETLDADPSLDSGLDHDPCRVVVFALPDDLGALEHVLTEWLHVSPADARIQIRHLPGLLAHRLTSDDAESICERIRNLGVDAVACSDSEVPDFRRASTVHHVRVQPDGFVIVSPNRPDEVLAWDRLRFISIGDVPQDGTRHFIASSIRIHAAPPHDSPPVDVLVHGAEMWLLFEAPERLIRIEHELMSYEYLGNRKTTSSAANFRTFVDDILVHCPHAFLTPSTRAFARHGSAAKYRFETPEQHRAAALLELLLMRRIRGQLGHDCNPTQRASGPVGTNYYHERSRTQHD